MRCLTSVIVFTAVVVFSFMASAEALLAIHPRPYGMRGRSAQAKSRRHLRALHRGYIDPLPSGFSAMAVPTAVVPRAKRAVAGLVATRAVELATKTHHPYTADLVRAVADQMPAEVVSGFAGIVQSANAAKHQTWLRAPAGKKTSLG